jgi:hypothetical protein
MLKPKKTSDTEGKLAGSSPLSVSTKIVNDEPPLTDTQTSTGMRQSLQKASAITRSWEKPSNEDGPVEEAFAYEDVTIGSIVLDEKNSRTRHILPGNPTANKLDESHPDFQENQDLIDGLIQFAEELKVSPLQSCIGVFSFRGKYKIAFGSRRYLAMKIAFGDRYKIPCKVYEKQPAHIATTRFIENSSRKDLPINAKLNDFKSSYEELLTIFEESSIYKHMGISKTSFYDFKKIYDNNLVFKAIMNKEIRSLKDGLFLLAEFKTSEKIEHILKVMRSEQIDISKALEFINTKSEHSTETADSNRAAEKKDKNAGRRRSSISFPKLTGESATKVAKRIIEGDLKLMPWDDVDWSDIDSITKALDKNINALLLEH